MADRTTIHITGDALEELGQKLSNVGSLDDQDRALLLGAFALAGEAVGKREQDAEVSGFSVSPLTSTPTTPPAPLNKGLVNGFKGSLGPQLGARPGAALDVGVDVNVNF